MVGLGQQTVAMPEGTGVTEVGAAILAPPCEPLQLCSFRQRLIRQEETIIFALIERAQFPLNKCVYAADDGIASVPSKGVCLLDYMLREVESTHARVRRYTSPDERAFFPESSSVTPVLPCLDLPMTIRPNMINVNAEIKRVYLEQVLPKITTTGEDSTTWGSSAVADIASLQALSKRIHYGKFIAEAKFQASPEAYTALIAAGDSEGIMSLLTDMPQEERVLNRVEKKASAYGQDPDSGENPEYKVDPKVIRALYKDIVMPLTKDVQVEYLLQRLTTNSVAALGPEASASHEVAKKRVLEFSASSPTNVLLEETAEKVFIRVLSNAVAFGVVAMESTRDGSVRHIKQMLVKFNLKIVAQDVVHDGDDEVRCVVIAKHTRKDRPHDDRSTVAFGLTNQSGALSRALTAFHDHNVNLTSIESLPAAQPQGPDGHSHDFFVELEGSLDDTPVQKALDALEKQTCYIRRLGSYTSVEAPQRKKQRCA